MIHLVDIDPGNWRLGLRVADSQKNYVSDSYAMLAEPMHIGSSGAEHL